MYAAIQCSNIQLSLLSEFIREEDPTKYLKDSNARLQSCRKNPQNIKHAIVSNHAAGKAKANGSNPSLPAFDEDQEVE